MEEEGDKGILGRSIVKQNTKKLGKLLEVAQRKYESLLSTSLKSSKKAFLKGKIDVFRRMV
jgi:hypothetical protein